MALRPFCILTVARFEHPEKALSPIYVTLEGIVISVSWEQYENEFDPIDVTLGGIIICVKNWLP